MRRTEEHNRGLLLGAGWMLYFIGSVGVGISAGVGFYALVMLGVMSYPSWLALPLSLCMGVAAILTQDMERAKV